MIRLSARSIAFVLHAAVSAGLALLLGSCGSGAVSSQPTTPTTLTISPATAITYSGLPTTFAIIGGRSPYIVVSSNQSALDVADNVNSNSFTVVPNTVSADTDVVLTVRDSLGGTATATVTVKPRTISNVVTITPSTAQPASCGTAICSGGDAQVKAVLTQAGVPISNRQVRFDVISGDFAFITSPPGSSTETTSTSVTTTTDSSGVAIVRIRAQAGARAQTALLQITDTAGGSTQRVSFQIAPSGGTLTALPNTVQFVGNSTTSCATGPSADVIVFGGLPPYQVSQPSGFIVRPTVLLASGDRFNITSVGSCTDGQTVSVLDSAGASANVTVSNVVGTQNNSPFTVAPTTGSLANCGDTVTFAMVGGSGTYIASSGSPYITTSITGSTGTVKRPAPSAGPGAATTVQVTFSDGRQVVTVPISLTGAAALACP